MLCGCFLIKRLAIDFIQLLSKGISAYNLIDFYPVKEALIQMYYISILTVGVLADSAITSKSKIYIFLT